jgi:hypothetical protein
MIEAKRTLLIPYKRKINANRTLPIHELKKIKAKLYGSRCTQLPVHRELTQWLLGPSPSLSVATDRPTDTGPDSNDVLTRSDLFS